jgi:phospholipid/cholesterol/gamma-HCH transport system substrate-binding protein
VKRGNEFLVGLIVLISLGLVVGGALWLSETNIGHQEALHSARFRTVGGLGVGAPVTYRGVRVGRVEAIRLADNNWVETDLKVYQGVELPQHPAVISASASLFGEWAATIVPGDGPQDDPNVRLMLDEASRAGGPQWPGATLPDVGQLTAQASRIASDIAALTNRVQSTFDTNAVIELRQSIKDFGSITNRLVAFTQTQTSKLNTVTGNFATTSDAMVGASQNLRSTLARVDSATQGGQLAEIVNSSRATSGNIQAASASLRELMDSARVHQASLVHVLLAADSLMTRIQSGNGTLGMLATDSTLYRETTATVIELRRLVQDIQVNPRKYFKFSVF